MLEEKLIRDSLLGLTWRYPFFAIPASRVILRGTRDDVPTMGVTKKGELYWNASFVVGLSPDARMGVLAHELCHLLYRHEERRGARDPLQWNIASDMAINAALKDAGITLPDSVLLPDAKRWDWIAEELYTSVKDGCASPMPAGGSEKGENSRPGEGCGFLPGEEESGEGESGEGESGAEESDAGTAQRWAEIGAQATTMAGKGKGAVLARITKAPPARVNWTAILKRGCNDALAQHGRDDQTFMRRSRRSLADSPIYLPGWKATNARVAVMVDTSGSVSDEEVSLALAETVKIAKQSEAKFFLVTHDHDVQWEGWVSSRTSVADIKKAAKGRGGTDPASALEAVSKAGKFDVMIHMTDGEMTWPDSRPINVRRAVVALVRKPRCGTRPTWARVIEMDVK